MAFPTALDSVSGSEVLGSLGGGVGLATILNNIETKLGIDSSAVVTTIDYLLKNTASIDPGHKHTTASLSGLPAFPSSAIVGVSDTQTLTNKTLTTPVLASFYQDAGLTKLMTVPAVASDTLVLLAAAQTLTNKTLTAPIIATISNTGTITLPTSTDTLVGRATTDTLTNKRRTRRVVTVTQSATPAINSDTTDVASITGLAQAITSMTTSLTGTAVAGDLLEIQITDNGIARAITWGTSFESTTIALPTTTVISTMLRIGLEWNTVASKWDCIAVA